MPVLLQAKLLLGMEMNLMEIQYNIQKLFLQILYNLLLHRRYQLFRCDLQQILLLHHQL
jgi:hypothetical protein